MSAEFGVNIDYTSLGRIHFKLELVADNHEQALKSAQDVLDVQKKWFRKHKEDAVKEHKRYKTLLRHGPDYDEEALKKLYQDLNPQNVEVSNGTNAPEHVQKTMSKYNNNSGGVF